MFLHLSVSHSVHRGSTWAGTAPRQVPQGRYTPYLAGTPPGQVHPQAGTPPGRYTPWQVHPRAGKAPLWQVPPLGRYNPPESSACWEIRATSGRYTSYCNAFLLWIWFHQQTLLCSFVLQHWPKRQWTFLLNSLHKTQRHVITVTRPARNIVGAGKSLKYLIPTECNSRNRK